MGFAKHNSNASVYLCISTIILEFMNHMHDNKKEFKQYISEIHQPGVFGQEGEERYLDKKELRKFRTKILEESKRLFEESKDPLISQFELISPECDLGRHSVVTVSGFLSEKDDNTEAWIGLCKSNLTLPVYSYRWSAKGTWCMLKPLIPTSVKDFFAPKALLKKIFLTYKVATLVFDYKAIFMHAIQIAKVSGKLLAHSLMLQFPFVNQSISLVGFSLGTQVIYSCLEELKAYNADNISKHQLFTYSLYSKALFPHINFYINCI